MNEYELIASFSLKKGSEANFVSELSDLIRKYGESEVSRLYKRDAGARVMLKNELIDEVSRLNAKIPQLQREVMRWRTAAMNKKQH